MGISLNIDKKSTTTDIKIEHKGLTVHAWVEIQLETRGEKVKVT